MLSGVVGSESAQDEVDGRSLLDEIAREGARRMLLAALETEVAAYLEAHREERDQDGHALVVRNGKGRTRKVTVGAGTISVSAPRVNDRRTDQDGERRRFTSRTGARGRRTVRRRVRPEVPEGRHDPGEGCRRAPDLLRLPRRALEAFADLERDRVAVRDGPTAPARDEGRGFSDKGPLDGLQAPRHGAGPLATTRRRTAAAARPRWHRLRGWPPAGGEDPKDERASVGAMVSAFETLRAFFV